MDKKGFWALLASVSKAWRTIFTRTNDSFRFRQAADDDNILLPESNGRAVINAIYGNTVKWNQLVKNGNFDDGITNWALNSGVESYSIVNSTITITKGRTSEGGIMTNNTVNFYKTHKYYISAECTISNANYTAWFGFSKVNRTQSSNFRKSTNSTNPKLISGIGSPTYDSTEEEGAIFTIGCGFATTPNGIYATFTNVMCIDLTAIFGTDTEIAAALGIQEADITTNTGVAAFEAWLALNVGEQDYYPYDEGSLISFKGTGIKSVGFNIWDKTGEIGKYMIPDGTVDPASTYTLSNYIHVLPNTNYYFKRIVASGAVSASICWYDAGKTFISSNVGNAGINNKVIQSPSNACYLRLSIYNANINYAIVNLSDPAKNGTYEPYWSDEKPFDVTKVYGTPGGSSTLVQVYPDGMFGALDETFGGDVLGYVYGSLLAWVAVRKIDLGNCIWSLVSGCNYTFETSIEIDAAEAIGYTYSETIDETDTTQDKLIGPTNGFHLTILDRSLSSTDLVDGHIAALEGVYVLITPYDGAVGYDNLVYRDNGVDTPLEQLFPFKYNVDKYSTEEVLVPASEAGEPTSTALVADIKYQITGHNYINDLFVDMGLPSGTLWAKCDIDITKPNGFCETPFTYEKSFFSWGNIDGHNPTSTSSFSPYDWGSSINGEPYTSSKGNTLQADIYTSKEYDAAMANLGQLFKMPTSTQFRELVNNCDFVQADGTTVIDDSVTDKLVTVNNIVGIYLKSKINGNLIFFSTSGEGKGSLWYYRGTRGYYLSTSFYSSSKACSLGFYEGGVNPQGNYDRYFGFAIRPIKN